MGEMHKLRQLAREAQRYDGDRVATLLETVS
jgi:hypothetical protein